MFRQLNSRAKKIHKTFLNALAQAVNPEARVIIVTDAGFQNAWFKHIKSLGWDFVGRIRGYTRLRLHRKGDIWHKPQELQAKSQPEYLGPGTLSRTQYARCEGHFYLHKTTPVTVLIRKNGDSKQWMPVSVGVDSLSNLRSNIYRITRLFGGEIKPQQFYTNEQQQGGFFDPLKRQ
ncbi:transposase [Yersinia enterocolitica]|uniref:transposase n=1 Tax=Yersinia enterocolitica TaxID=630 RepID=UPI003AB6B1A1